MNNITKNALEESLKKFLLQKPLDKITISDLTTDCGISRMAFYYHFKDIYDLVEWACIEDASRALQGKKTYDTWQEGLLQIFEAVLENKPFILNVYRSVSRERVENYLYALTYELIEGVVEEQSENLMVTEEQKKFIANFYKYSFVGVMLDWIKQDMKEDPERIVERLGILIQGDMDRALNRLRTDEKPQGSCRMENFYGRKRNGQGALSDGAGGWSGRAGGKKIALYRKRPSGRIRSRGGCVY